MLRLVPSFWQLQGVNPTRLHCRRACSRLCPLTFQSVSKYATHQRRRSSNTKANYGRCEYLTEAQGFAAYRKKGLDTPTPAPKPPPPTPAPPAPKTGARCVHNSPKNQCGSCHTASGVPYESACGGTSSTAYCQTNPAGCPGPV